jgi:predicted HTH transcriptional regulator
LTMALAALVASNPALDPKLNDQQTRVLAYVQEHGQITNQICRDLFNTSRSGGLRLLSEMEGKGYLSLQGKGRGTRYILASNSD